MDSFPQVFWKESVSYPSKNTHWKGQFAKIPKTGTNVSFWNFLYVLV